MSFLPENYQAPKQASYYLKLMEGENRIRIMSKPIIGWEDWQDKKPMRFRMDQKPNKPVDSKKPIKHFWAFIVFNYNEEEIQIMQVSQATVRKSLEALCRDSDWGSPYAYDIKITKKGEGVDTEYAVNPVPHKTIDPYLVACFSERPINLEALFTGEDPFSKQWTKEHLTPLADHNTGNENAFSSPASKVLPFKDEKVTKEQALHLTQLFVELPEEFKKQVHDFMQKQKIEKYEDMTTATYERVLKQAIVEKGKLPGGKDE